MSKPLQYIFSSLCSVLDFFKTLAQNNEFMYFWFCIIFISNYLCCIPHLVFNPREFAINMNYKNANNTLV